MLKNVLQSGKKYTILKFDGKGWPETEKFILQHVSKKLDRTTLVKTGSAHELKWDKFIILKNQDQYMIWQGWHKVNTAISASRGLTNKGSICEKRWDWWDPRYLLRAKQELQITPIAEYLRPLQPERLTIYQTISEQQ